MSIPQHILYNVGSTVAIDVPVRPASTQTVSCYSDGGAAIFSAQAATLSTISTTLSGAVSPGDTTLTVANATGIATGLDFWVRTPSEKFRCRTISGSTVTLTRPAIYAHANGSTVQGTRLTYPVTAAQAATKFWDGRLEWLIDDGAATEALYIQAACCTQYPFHTNLVTEQDLLDEDPKFGDLIDSEVDTQRLIVKGSQDVMKRLEAVTQGRGFSYIGDFTDAIVFACLARVHRTRGGDVSSELYERYTDLLKAEMETLLAGCVYRDADLDGAVEGPEQVSARSRRMLRA